MHDSLTPVRIVDPRRSADRLQRTLVLGFAPIYKLYFGVAVGVATGLSLFLLTTVHLLRSPGTDRPLILLAEYFYGYTVTWTGAFVALLWGFGVGFVGGWFLAFCRNFTLALSLFLTRSSAELTATSDFLDHV